MSSFKEINQDTSLSIGEYGAVYESGTTSVTGSFGAIQVLGDAVFNSLTASNWTGDTLASLNVPAGVTLFGNFTAFQLTSGRVVAYNNA